MFNLFNAKNPALPITSQRVDAATGAQQASFMQPVAYAGDFQQPEQRSGRSVSVLLLDDRQPATGHRVPWPVSVKPTPPSVTDSRILDPGLSNRLDYDMHSSHP